MRWLLLMTLVACRDRTPPPPPCDGVNEAVTSQCHSPPPLDCETASDDFIRCVDDAAAQSESCAPLRQKVARCVVKYTD